MSDVGIFYDLCILFSHDFHLFSIQSPSMDQRPADDYDSPWESKSSLFGVKQNSPQAPVSDNRPADDYDKPWEWNKKWQSNGHTQPPKQHEPFKSPKANNLSDRTQAPKQHEPLQSPKADERPADDYDAPWEWSKMASMVQGKEGEVLGGAAAPPKKPPRTFEVEPAINPKLPLEQQG